MRIVEFTLAAMLAATAPRGECRIWTGSLRGKGYGQIWDPRTKRQRGAHVVAWELFNERPAPRGLQVAHTCDTPACIEPRHLFLTDQSGNERDKWRKGRGWAPQSPRNPRTGRFCK